MLSNKCTWVGIGVELDTNFRLYNELITLNNEIADYDNKSFKFSALNQPHLNLYDLDLPKENLQKIITILKDGTKGVQTFEAQITGIKAFDFGIIYLELEKHPLLQQIHEKIVKAVSELKKDCVCQDYLQPWRKYTAEQKLSERH